MTMVVKMWVWRRVSRWCEGEGWVKVRFGGLRYWRWSRVVALRSSLVVGGSERRVLWVKMKVTVARAMVVVMAVVGWERQWIGFACEGGGDWESVRWEVLFYWVRDVRVVSCRWEDFISGEGFERKRECCEREWNFFVFCEEKIRINCEWRKTLERKRSWEILRDFLMIFLFSFSF